jgi:SAM-dependent methyltransferase
MSTPAPIDPAAFREFEHRRWESAVSAYDRYFGPLTSLTIEPLLDGVAASGGMRVLDVATGPGYVAAAARRRGCTVEGVDFSAEMIAVAQREAAEGIIFRVGDAEDLPYADSSFNAVVMNFGVLHLSRPEVAFSEAYRVLKPDGWFGFTAWRPAEEACGFALMLRAIEKAGDPHVPLPAGPPFFRFSEPAECERVLAQAGFAETRAQTLPLTWTIPSAEAMYQAFYAGTARTGGLLQAQTGEAAAEIRWALLESTGPYLTVQGELRIPMPALLAVGRKSAPHAH